MPKTFFNSGQILEAQHLNDINEHVHDVGWAEDSSLLSDRHHRKINIVNHTEGILPAARVVSHEHFVKVWDAPEGNMWVMDITPHVTTSANKKYAVILTLEGVVTDNFTFQTPGYNLVADNAFPAVFTRLNNHGTPIYSMGQVQISRGANGMVIRLIADADAGNLQRTCFTFTTV